MEKLCNICSKSFIGMGGICSYECRLIYKNNWRKNRRISLRKTLICKWCQKPFSSGFHKVLYCSKQCMTYAYQKKAGTKNPGYEGTIHSCIICKKEYPAPVSTSRYCSPKCRRRNDYLKNRDKKIADAVMWGRNNPDKRKKYRKNWESSHRNNHLHNKRLNAHKRRIIGGSFTLIQWNQLLEKQNNICSICNLIMDKPTVDHIISVKKWPSWRRKNIVKYKCNDIENIQAVHLKCNSSKGSKIS